MRKMFSKLWADDRGFVISTELLFVTVILVIGVVSGLAALRNGVLYQAESVATAITALDASYNTTAVNSTGGGSNGSAYTYTNGAATGVSVTATTPTAAVVAAPSINLAGTTLVP